MTHHSTGPSVRPASTDTKPPAALPVTSCTAPLASPPPGNAASIEGMPNGIAG